jgi:hypothetical protein
LQQKAKPTGVWAEMETPVLLFFLPSTISPPQRKKYFKRYQDLSFYADFLRGQNTKSRVAGQGNFARKTIRQQNFHIRHEFDFFFFSRFPNKFFRFCSFALQSA